jgi:hypothetical protein
MAVAPTSRRWQVFLVVGLIACIASLYFLIGGATFAAISGLVTLSIAVLNAFLSPPTIREGENWFVDVMKRTLVIGGFAKAVCVLLWIAFLGIAAVLLSAEYEKKYRVDIEGVVVDKWRGTPLEKSLVTLKLSDGAILSADAPVGRFKFNAVDTRKVARGQAELQAVCEGVRGKLPVDLLRGSVNNVQIVLSVSLPPIKRTFVVLTGHMIDDFVRDKRLPTEFEKSLSGNVIFVDTPASRELGLLMDKFSDRIKDPNSLKLYSEEVDSEKQDAQTRQREAALKKIEKDQLKRLTEGRILPAAGGQQHIVDFDVEKLPASFFATSPWSVSILGTEISGNRGTKARDATRFEIPLAMVQLRKFVTNADLDVLRPAQHPDDQVIRFLQYVSRNGMPPNFLLLSAGPGCGEDPYVIIDPPKLQLLVGVLENVTEKPVQLGEFHFRLAAPAGGEYLVRTTQQNAKLLTASDSKSETWYRPRVLRPGEKLAMPVELTLSYAGMDRMDDMDSDQKERDEEQLRSDHQWAERLTSDKKIQMIELIYQKDYLNAKGDAIVRSKKTSLARIPKQQFIDGLRRERLRITKTDEFVYGPSIILDSVDVNGASYPIERFNPKTLSYNSGSTVAMGSCPFVYSSGGTDDKWLKQGSILRGRASKALEGTGELTVRRFDGVLRISEEETETSYVDEILVRGRSATGENITVRPADERLARKDRHYLVLKKGESIDIRFDVPSGFPTDHVQVIASGYFEPTTSKRAQ